MGWLRETSHAIDWLVTEQLNLTQGPFLQILKVLIPEAQGLHKGDMGPIGSTHRHYSQNEKHELKGDVALYLKVNQLDK